jgi:3-dehydroquinate synthase
MCIAADLSARLGLLSTTDVQRVEHAVSAAGLPTRITGLDRARALESMQGDKKAEAGAIRFVLLQRIGQAVQRTVPQAALLASLTAAGYV